MGLNAPFTLTTTQNNATQGGKFPWAVGFDQNVNLVKNFGNQGPGTPTVGLVGINAEDRNIRSSYIYQYSLGIQRRLGAAFSLEVDYQGSNAHKLGLFVDQNQPAVIVRDPTMHFETGPPKKSPNEQVFPNPFFGSVGTGKDLGNSNYNGMVVTTRYQGRHGIFFEGSYTLGKSLDYGSAFFGSSGEAGGGACAQQILPGLARTPFVVRHHAVFTYVI